MYKYILLIIFLVSCKSITNLNKEDQYACIDYLQDKGVSFTDALKACEYKFEEGLK